MRLMQRLNADCEGSGVSGTSFNQEVSDDLRGILENLREKLAQLNPVSLDNLRDIVMLCGEATVAAECLDEQISNVTGLKG